MDAVPEISLELEHPSHQVISECPLKENHISNKRKHVEIETDEGPAETSKQPKQLFEDEESDDGAFCPIVSTILGSKCTR